MQCQCGVTAQYVLGRDGKPAYTCANSRCKFWAVGPTTSEGYSRVSLTTSNPPAGTIIVRFEALVHPVKSGVPAVMAMCEGNLYPHHPVRRVMEDPLYEGKWFPSRKAYLFTLPHYAPVLTRLQRLSAEYHQQSRDGMSSRPTTLHVLIEPVPNFFFKCLDQGNQLARQFSDCVPDEEDIVYQQLQSFQRKGVEFIIRHGGRGMIADEMGLGKTVQAIAVAHFYRHEWPLLVVCPMSLMENWAKEISRFCSIPFGRIGLVQGRKTAVVPDVQDVVITSYTSLPALVAATGSTPVTAPPYRVVICDESHYIKGADTKRTRSALEVCKSANRVILLSGTPALSRPIELYTQLRAIAPPPPAPSILPSSTQFSARYCNAHVQSRGGTFTVNTEGHSHMDELHLLLQHFMIRRSKSELGNTLPSKSRQLLYVTVQEKEKAMMAKQVSSLRKTVVHSHASTGRQSGNGGDYEEVGEVLTHRTPNAFELKIATAQAKIPAVTDYIISTIEKHQMTKSKIIIFAHHQCMMEALKAAVERAGQPSHPIDYIVIAGDTPANQREALADHFRSAPTCLVAILSMQSSGVGHNFTCASTVIFAELDWNPSTHLQCEDRVHRIGQSKPCVIQYLLAEGTSDAVIWPLLNAKLSVTTAMLGGAGAWEAPASAPPDSHSTDSQNHGKKNTTVGGGSAPTSSLSSSSAATLEGEGAEKLFVGRRDGSHSQSHGTQRTLDAFLSTPTAEQGSGGSKNEELSPGKTEKAAATDASEEPPSGLSSPLLCPLMSFDEIAAMDPVWRDTAHSRVIPGVPPLPKATTYAHTATSPAEALRQQPLQQPKEPHFSVDKQLSSPSNQHFGSSGGNQQQQPIPSGSPITPPSSSVSPVACSTSAGQAAVCPVRVASTTGVSSTARRTVLSWASVNTAVAQAAVSPIPAPPLDSGIGGGRAGNGGNTGTTLRRRTTFTFQQQQQQQQQEEGGGGSGSSVPAINGEAPAPVDTSTSTVAALEQPHIIKRGEEESTIRMSHPQVKGDRDPVSGTDLISSSMSRAVDLHSHGNEEAVEMESGRQAAELSVIPHTKRPRSSSNSRDTDNGDGDAHHLRQSSRRTESALAAEHVHGVGSKGEGSSERPSRSFTVHFSPPSTTSMIQSPPTSLQAHPSGVTGDGEVVVFDKLAHRHLSVDRDRDESTPSKLTPSAGTTPPHVPPPIAQSSGDGDSVNGGVAAFARVAVVKEDILLPIVTANTTPCRPRAATLVRGPLQSTPGSVTSITPIGNRTIIKIGTAPAPALHSPPPLTATTVTPSNMLERTTDPETLFSSTSSSSPPLNTPRLMEENRPPVSTTGATKFPPAPAPTGTRRTIVSRTAALATSGAPAKTVHYPPAATSLAGSEGGQIRKSHESSPLGCASTAPTTETAPFHHPAHSAGTLDFSSMVVPPDRPVPSSSRVSKVAVHMNNTVCRNDTTEWNTMAAAGLVGRHMDAADGVSQLPRSNPQHVTSRPTRTRTVVSLQAPHTPPPPSAIITPSPSPQLPTPEELGPPPTTTTTTAAPGPSSSQIFCSSVSPASVSGAGHATPPTMHALLSGETLLQTVTRQSSSVHHASSKSTRKTFILQKTLPP